ncbi:hypothetical protein [Ralstonia pseudosolanacearum]|uniref:hypothetical protein n=1 Tax=Ralstonia pseudosolanacearum TaxID=1310165 RepID=UPI003CF0097F
MDHLRSNWRTYLVALVCVAALATLFFVVLPPMFGITLRQLSPVKVGTILLLAGALLRFLLHAVDGIDRKQSEASSTGQ